MEKTEFFVSAFVFILLLTCPLPVLTRRNQLRSRTHGGNYKIVFDDGSRNCQYNENPIVEVSCSISFYWSVVTRRRVVAAEAVSVYYSNSSNFQTLDLRVDSQFFSYFIAWLFSYLAFRSSNWDHHDLFIVFIYICIYIFLIFA